MYHEQVLGADELQNKYEELREVDENALKFENLKELKAIDPTFYEGYLEESQNFKANPWMFTQRQMKGISQKYCLKITTGEEDVDISKIGVEEQLHTFIIENFYNVFNEENATVKSAKGFIKNHVEPYTIVSIDSY